MTCRNPLGLTVVVMLLMSGLSGLIMSPQADAGGSRGISVTSPTMGDELFRGEETTITWDSNATSGMVAIKLLDGGYNYVLTIATSTADTGSYAWTPKPTTPLGQYILEISDAGVNDTKSLSGTFELVGWIDVTSPALDDTWETHGTFRIEWDSRGTSGSLEIRCMDFTIDRNAQDKGYYIWDIPADFPLVHPSYIIYVQDAQQPLDLFNQSDPFKMTGGQPPVTLSITNPVGGEEFADGDRTNITWEISRTGGAIEIQLWKDDEIQYVMEYLQPDDRPYEWGVAGGMEGGQYQICLFYANDTSITDCSGYFRIIQYHNVDPPGGNETDHGGDNWTENLPPQLQWITIIASDLATLMQMCCLVLVVVVIAYTVIIYYIGKASGKKSGAGRKSMPDDPLYVLDQRYARGEINRDAYETMRRDMER